MQAANGDSHSPSIRVRGRLLPFLERRRIGRRDLILLEQIGGPFRQRYRAFDPRSGPDGDFFLVQRLPHGPGLDQRLRVLRRLKHDNFPRLWEWQRHRDGIDVVLSWIEGIPLDMYFQNIREKRRPAVDPSQAVRLIHGLANGVAHLHRQVQLMHGDVQPANVVLTSHPSRLVLIDFGSAWTMQTTMLRDDGDGHNRAYCAPELQRGVTPVGFHADQFSVTVLLFELLTGVLPYEGLGGRAGRDEHADAAHDGFKLPSEVNRDLRRLPRSLRDGLDQLCRTGLSLNSSARYQGHSEWLNDLFAVMAQFRLVPELPPTVRWLSRVVDWFGKSESR